CFNAAFCNLSLIQVLDKDRSCQNKGSFRNFGFHTVAALLNAASPDVNFGLSLCDVIEGFNAAVADGSNSAIQAQKNIFASFNECGAEDCENDDPHCCPLGNCRCSDSHEVCCPGCEGADDTCPAGETCGGSNQGDSDCCEDHGGAGCDDNQCEGQVCNELPECCNEPWDADCADKALEICCAFLCQAPIAACGDFQFFTTQAEFEAFTTGQGNVLVGVEDYEASILPPTTSDGADDPLQFGIANGAAYPIGTQGLADLTTQSNNLGGAPVVPSPHGVLGLAAKAAGFFGAASDVVVANYFVDSLDLIFSGNNVGIGFETVTLLGGTTVEIRVFDTCGNMIGMTTVDADATGTNFIGVVAPTAIGRINIFDPADGAEGGDNVQAWAGGCTTVPCIINANSGPPPEPLPRDGGSLTDSAGQSNRGQGVGDSTGNEPADSPGSSAGPVAACGVLGFSMLAFLLVSIVGLRLSRSRLNGARKQ
ncbi:MAG: hypothetical protein IIB58_08615, partial [Planctomycetes bacterium]|nr:hypothetical protein [Planctomycetota bacterium]